MNNWIHTSTIFSRKQGKFASFRQTPKRHGRPDAYPATLLIGKWFINRLGPLRSGSQQTRSSTIICCALSGSCPSATMSRTRLTKTDKWPAEQTDPKNARSLMYNWNIDCNVAVQYVSTCYCQMRWCAAFTWHVFAALPTSHLIIWMSWDWIWGLRDSRTMRAQNPQTLQLLDYLECTSPSLPTFLPRDCTKSFWDAEPESASCSMVTTSKCTNIAWFRLYVWVSLDWSIVGFDSEWFIERDTCHRPVPEASSNSPLLQCYDLLPLSKFQTFQKPSFCMNYKPCKLHTNPKTWSWCIWRFQTSLLRWHSGKMFAQLNSLQNIPKSTEHPNPVSLFPLDPLMQLAVQHTEPLLQRTWRTTRNFKLLHHGDGG